TCGITLGRTSRKRGVALFRPRSALHHVATGLGVCLLSALLLCVPGVLGGSSSVQDGARKIGKAPKYGFPQIMVIVYADFPNEPEHQLALAKYTAAKGFNCVEAEMDKLDVCRKAGLRVRLGSIDIDKMLQAAPKLKDDPAVFAYFISDRRTRQAFPGFAKT